MDRMTKWMVLAVGLSAVAALCVAETEPVDVDTTEIVEQDVEQGSPLPQEPQEEQIAPQQENESEGDSLDGLLDDFADNDVPDNDVHE